MTALLRSMVFSDEIDRTFITGIGKPHLPHTQCFLGCGSLIGTVQGSKRKLNFITISNKTGTNYTITTIE